MPMPKKFNIEEKFETLFKVFSSQRFLKRESLGNEIAFFVQPFQPEFQTKIDIQIPHLIKRLKKENIFVLEINLYSLCIELLKKNNEFENVIEAEPEMSKTDLFEALNGPLNVEKEIIPAIRKSLKDSECQIVFLTGIGAIYPLIRSHTILNNLQSLIKEVPLVMFFPGQYNNISFTLFGRLKDENYYRAFNLDYRI
jgi:hypothetical protein